MHQESLLYFSTGSASALVAPPNLMMKGWGSGSAASSFLFRASGPSTREQVDCQTRSSDTMFSSGRQRAPNTARPYA